MIRRLRGPSSCYAASGEVAYLNALIHSSKACLFFAIVLAGPVKVMK
jgi:hypothetical protein